MRLYLSILVGSSNICLCYLDLLEAEILRPIFDIDVFNRRLDTLMPTPILIALRALNDLEVVLPEAFRRFIDQDIGNHVRYADAYRRLVCAEMEQYSLSIGEGQQGRVPLSEQNLLLLYGEHAFINTGLVFPQDEMPEYIPIPDSNYTSLLNEITEDDEFHDSDRQSIHDFFEEIRNRTLEKAVEASSDSNTPLGFNDVTNFTSDGGLNNLLLEHRGSDTSEGEVGQLEENLDESSQTNIVCVGSDTSISSRESERGQMEEVGGEPQLVGRNVGDLESRFLLRDAGLDVLMLDESDDSSLVESDGDPHIDRNDGEPEGSFLLRDAGLNVLNVDRWGSNTHISLSEEERSLIDESLGGLQLNRNGGEQDMNEELERNFLLAHAGLHLLTVDRWRSNTYISLSEDSLMEESFGGPQLYRNGGDRDKNGGVLNSGYVTLDDIVLQYQDQESLTSIEDESEEMQHYDDEELEPKLLALISDGQKSADRFWLPESDEYESSSVVSLISPDISSAIEDSVAFGDISNSLSDGNIFSSETDLEEDDISIEEPESEAGNFDYDNERNHDRNGGEKNINIEPETDIIPVAAGMNGCQFERWGSNISTTSSEYNILQMAINEIDPQLDRNVEEPTVNAEPVVAEMNDCQFERWGSNISATSSEYDILQMAINEIDPQLNGNVEEPNANAEPKVDLIPAFERWTSNSSAISSGNESLMKKNLFAKDSDSGSRKSYCEAKNVNVDPITDDFEYLENESGNTDIEAAETDTIACMSDGDVENCEGENTSSDIEDPFITDEEYDSDDTSFGIEDPFLTDEEPVYNLNDCDDGVKEPNQGNSDYQIQLCFNGVPFAYLG